MPILVRPVREQLEHDRIIRLLQVRYKRKHDSVANISGEPPTTIVIGTLEFVPDLILLTDDKARKLEGVVEVETGESVNSLETLAQWGPFSRLRVPFHLYVPPQSLDTVRRLCRDHNVTVAELWTYHTNLDQVRFTMVQKAPDAAVAAAKKVGLAGTPKLKVAPPPPPPLPPPPPPPPPPQPRAAETKAPVRTAAQKVALGKFVAAAKASAAKHALPAPAPGSSAAPTAAVAKGAIAASRAKLGAPSAKAPVAEAKVAPVPVAKAAPLPVAKVAGKPVAKAAPVAAPKPAPAPAAKPASAGKAAPAGRPAKPAPIAVAKLAAKPAAKPAAKATTPAKPLPKATGKAPAKAVGKPAKAAGKPAKPVAKPAVKKPAAPVRGAKHPAGAKRR